MADTFKGMEIELHRFAGARVLRVVHPGRQDIDEHRHDWAYIGIYTMGGYREIYDGGEAEMAGPGAVLHPPGRPHADVVGDSGLETLTIEFDPVWFRAKGFDGQLDRSRVWNGGRAGLAARQLGKLVGSGKATEPQIGHAANAFLRFALNCREAPRPSWLKRVQKELARPQPPSTEQLARMMSLHPAWLARAYRDATGEGLQDTASRKRVERACSLLRKTESTLTEIALVAGFCDQSHMNRRVRGLLGRTPLQVRNERWALGT